MNNMMEPKIRFKGFEGEWKTSTIGDFTTSFSGGTPTAGASEFYGGNIPFIRSGEIHESKTELFLTEAGLNNSSAKVVEKGTLLYALYGATSGEVGISKIRGAINQAILAIYPNKTVDKRFLANYLQSHKQKIVGELLQGGQGNLSGALVKSISVTYPNNREQQTISDYVDSLDSQISAATSRLASLKQMKAASLQAMFPQEGETVPKIRFKGFEGEWNISRLGDFSTSFSGGTPTAGVAEFYGGEIPFIRSGEIHENRTELFLTEAGINNSSAKVVEKGTLLYALYGATSGEVGISKIKGAINQAILAIYPNKSVNKIFLSNYLQLKKQRIVGEFLQGGQGNLSGALVKSILVTYPSLEEQQAIASYFTSLDRQISLQSQRLEKLKQIKSACLDKMFV